MPLVPWLVHPAGDEFVFLFENGITGLVSYWFGECRVQDWGWYFEKGKLTVTGVHKSGCCIFKESVRVKADRAVPEHPTIQEVLIKYMLWPTKPDRDHGR